MSENETALGAGATDTPAESPAAEAPAEDISYHAVEKDGVVTAIWEMNGRKHVRTIDPKIAPGPGHSPSLHHRASRRGPARRSKRSSFVLNLL